MSELDKTENQLQHLFVVEQVTHACVFFHTYQLS